MPTRRSVLAGLSGAAMMGHARAQERFPSRPIRFIVPYAPGGATDIIARLVGQEMQKAFGQPVVVENRPGALGILAIETVARSRPDGYTLMVGNVTTNAITPVVFKSRMTLDYEQSIVPVARLGELPSVLCVTNVNFPPRSMEELIEYARQHPGRVNYVTAGVGSYTHFDHVLLARRGRSEMTHIPFTTGAGGFVSGLISGDTQIGLTNAATAIPLVKSGQLRAFAVVSEVRLPDLPEVPTMAELGYPGVGTVAWNAMFGPSGMPRDVLEALHSAAVAAVNSAPVQEAFRRGAIRPVPTSSPDDARSWLQGEIVAWRRIADEVQLDAS
jgi:tripartite-type tricarboxylate transporter receptor subunit TctC